MLVAGVPPSTPDVEFSVTPLGKPLVVNTGAGKSPTPGWTVNEFEVPAVNVVLATLVMCGAWLTTIVKFCDAALIPELHTVMFYDLYEDAGGAYGHDDFAEHRAYLLDRIAAGQPAAYFPESAYWVAFDDSVQLYLPLYVRSRWLDLDRLAADPAAHGKPLDEHLIFSSGWEWGYWLGDYAALRASYQRPALITTSCIRSRSSRSRPTSMRKPPES